MVGLVKAGAWAQFAAISTSRLAAIPDELSDAQAATLPTAGLTALRALEVAGLLLGKQVLITGATGGVGRMAVQLAQASGAHVTALVRDAGAAREILRRLGAAHVVEQISGDFDLTSTGSEARRSASPSSTSSRVASSSTSRRRATMKRSAFRRRGSTGRRERGSTRWTSRTSSRLTAARPATSTAFAG